MSLKHFCHQCNVYFHKAVDFVIHRHNHVETNTCKQCGKNITKYSNAGVWDIIGEDDQWMHVKDEKMSHGEW